jgi:hypothetical protein
MAPAKNDPGYYPDSGGVSKNIRFKVMHLMDTIKCN